MNRPVAPTSTQSSALVLLGITVLCYLIQTTTMAWGVLALWPLGHGFGPWQLVSYGFLHGGLAHLFFNMFALYMFGLPIERAWGTRRFLIFYFVCMVGAGLVQLLVTALTGAIYPTIGASGAVFGLLLAYGMMFPNSTILLLIPPVPIKAKWFVIGYGLLTLFFGMTGTMAGVAHFAHLGGMLFGLALILIWGRSDFRRRRG